MTEEDKKLLLKDLCARLPYDLMVKVTLDNDRTFIARLEKINSDGKEIELEIDYEDEEISDYFNNVIKEHPEVVKEVIPYLRPMSDMSIEECCEFADLDESTDDWYDIPNAPFYFGIATYKQIDWLNSHHFDFRGLIEKDLAIAINKNIDYKTILI